VTVMLDVTQKGTFCRVWAIELPNCGCHFYRLPKNVHFHLLNKFMT